MHLQNLSSSNKDLTLWDSLLLENSPTLRKDSCSFEDFKSTSDNHHRQNLFKEAGDLDWDSLLFNHFDDSASDSNEQAIELQEQCQGSGPTTFDANEQMNFCLESQVGVERETQEPIDISQEAAFEEVFKFKDIRKGWKKNTNVPKFLVRIFMKHFTQFNPQKSNRKLIESNKKAKKEMSKVESNNFKISHILRLLSDSDEPCSQLSKAKRQIMSSILNGTRQEEIIDNHYISGNKISYMIASKIYALRCRSQGLTERVQVF